MVQIFTICFKSLNHLCPHPLHAFNRGRANPENTPVEMRGKDCLRNSVGGVLFSQLIKRATGKQSRQWTKNAVSHAGTVYHIISSSRHLSLLFSDIITLLDCFEGQVWMEKFLLSLMTENDIVPRWHFQFLRQISSSRNTVKAIDILLNLSQRVCCKIDPMGTSWLVQ